MIVVRCRRERARDSSEAYASVQIVVLSKRLTIIVKERGGDGLFEVAIGNYPHPEEVWMGICCRAVRGQSRGGHRRKETLK
jgi:hypothetical protein